MDLTDKIKYNISLNDLEKQFKILDQTCYKTLLTPSTIQVITDVKQMTKELFLGPAGEDMDHYLKVEASELEFIEFQLARFAEVLNEKQSEIEKRYSYTILISTKEKELFAKYYLHVKSDFKLKEDKFTENDIKSSVDLLLSELREKNAVIYGLIKYLKSFTDSINRYIICLTHRIKDLQQQKTYKF